MQVESVREGNRVDKRHSMFLSDNTSPNEMRERSNTFSASKLYSEEKTKNKKQALEEIEVTPSSEESFSSSGSSRNNLSKSVSKNSLLKIFKIK